MDGVTVTPFPCGSVSIDLGVPDGDFSAAGFVRAQDGSGNRLNVDDLEAWLRSTGDAAAVVEYLAAKYLDNDARRRERAVAQLEAMLPQLAAQLAQLKGGA